jgi:hypothetical protein
MHSVRVERAPTRILIPTLHQRLPGSCATSSDYVWSPSGDRTTRVSTFILGQRRFVF